MTKCDYNHTNYTYNNKNYRVICINNYRVICINKAIQFTTVLIDERQLYFARCKDHEHEILSPNHVFITENECIVGKITES